MSDKFYILKAGAKFLAEDYTSGGYPYETDRVLDARRFEKLDEPFQWLGRLRTSHPNARVVQMKVELEEVPQMFIDKAVAERALSKLTDEEKIVLGFLS